MAMRWRDLLSSSGPLLLPGAYDAFSATLIKRAGFQAYVLGGFSMTASRYGLPDLGLVGLRDMVAVVEDVTRACDLPVLVDGDNGYGDVMNVVHTVQTYERMGVAALFLEDQAMPKRCGHLKGKQIIPTTQMERKIAAACAARNNRDLFLIARTDAREVYGLDEALSRAERYLRAGADGLFVEAPQSVAELERIAKAFDVPQFCNMLIGGRTPILSNRELFDMGYAMIVHGTTPLMAAGWNTLRVLEAIRRDQLAEFSGVMLLEEYAEILQTGRWIGIGTE